MKYTNLHDFQKDLEGTAPNQFASIYMIIANDDYERKEAFDCLSKALSKVSSDAKLSQKSFSADNVQIPKVIEELNTINFFSKSRLVAVHLGDKPTKAMTEPLESYFDSPNRDVKLVITLPSVKQSTSFYQKAEKNGIVLELPETKPWQKEKVVATWLAQKVTKDGFKIDPQASKYMLQQLGTDQDLLTNELEKLYCYIGDRKAITTDDVCAVSSNVNSETAWQLGEAIFSQDTKSAIRICKALTLDGVPFMTLLRQVRGQFQTEFQVCSILSNGGNKNDVAKQFPYMKGFILDRHAQMAMSYGLARFKEGIMDIDAAELASKSSGADPDLLVELLIIKLSIPRRK